MNDNYTFYIFLSFLIAIGVGFLALAWVSDTGHYHYHRFRTRFFRHYPAVGTIVGRSIGTDWGESGADGDIRYVVGIVTKVDRRLRLVLVEEQWSQYISAQWYKVEELIWLPPTTPWWKGLPYSMREGKVVDFVKSTPPTTPPIDTSEK